MYRTIGLNDKDQWNKFVLSLPINKSDVYYLAEYYEIYQNNGDGEATCFVFQDGSDIAIYPFLKNKLPEFYSNSKGDFFDIQGAYGYNGVISSSNDTSFIDNFYSAFNEYCVQENIIAEFTRFHPLLQNQEFSGRHMKIIEDRNTVWLNLDQPYEEIWSTNFSSVNRNMIRKGLKNDITVEIAEDKNSYRIFSEIYAETMTNVNASEYYFFSDRYIEDIKNLLPNNHKLLVAKYNGEIICSMLMLYHGNYAHYHLSGRKREYSRLAGNNVILNEAIKIAQTLGCNSFHFGGGTSSNPGDDLLKFKSNFSKDTCLFSFGKKVHNKEVYSEIVNQWEELNPDKKNSMLLLKYRS